MPSSNFPITHVLVDCENVALNGLTDLVVKTDGTPLKFVLFHNSTNKINISLTQLKDFGYALSDDRVELVELAIPENMTKKQAENALDFYIAYYMGTVMPFSPFNSHCVILSKDHDYDPLVLHVQKQYGEGRCERVESYEALAKMLGITVAPQKVASDLLPKASDTQPQKSTEKTESVQKKVEPTVEKAKNTSNQKSFDLQKAIEKAKLNLKKMSKNRPTTKTRLQNSLKSLFTAGKLTDANIQSLIDALQKAKVLEILKDTNKVKYK